MARTLTDPLSEQLGKEVRVASTYRRGDKRYFDPSSPPSLELADRIGHQLGFDGLPEGVVPIGHSRGARIASHFLRKPNEVMLAPEGITAGGKELAARFATDVLRRAVTGGDRRFARRQIGNILHSPIESARQAAEMARTATPQQFELGRRALVVMYEGDQVIDPASIERLQHAPGVTFEQLAGGHYAPFVEPIPTVDLVTHYLRRDER